MMTHNAAAPAWRHSSNDVILQRNPMFASICQGFRGLSAKK